MAKAGITIAISGTYNGRALEKARRDLEKMRVSAVSELGGAGQALVDFGADLAEQGGKIHNVGYQLESVGKKATTGITLPMAAAAVACGKAAIDMDTSLTNVRKTVDGTEAQYQDLKKSAIEFSKTNAVSASQIMDLQSLGAQLGYNINELDMFGQVVSGLDIATNMDAETAGTELAQFANITKMAHSETSNYASAIVGLGNNMATTEADISHMALRIAAAGTQVGMSQADVLGLAAALSSMGIEAEAGGTAISTIISQIDKDIASNSDSVETWAKTAGMSAQEFADAWRKDPVQALGALLSNMENTTAEGGNMSVMLEELGIDSVRQTDIMKRLAGNSELVTKAVSLANDEWKKNTALSREVENRNSSMSARLQILVNKATAVAEKFGTPLVNALIATVDAADPLIEAVSDVAQGFADMDEADQRMIITLAAAAAAFGPLSAAGGKVLQLVGDARVALGSGAQSLGVFVTGLADASRECGGAANMVGQVATGTLDLGSAATDASGKVSMAATATNALGTAMKAVPIALAIGLVGDLVGQFKAYLDHEHEIESSTLGLMSAIDAASESYGRVSVSMGDAGRSLDELKEDTDKVTRSQVELAKKVRETWSEYGTNAGMVDFYASEIEGLSQKSSLTAGEQERLKVAVENYNSITGSAVEVTNAQTGELNIQADALSATTEAYKEYARVQAAKELYNDTVKQQTQNTLELQKVTDELANAEKGLCFYIGDFAVLSDATGDKYHELEKRKSELEAQGQSLNYTLEQEQDILAAAGTHFSSLDEALQNSGVSMSDFGEISSEQLSALQGSFDGSLASIVRACNEQGIQIPQTLADAINSNAPSATTAASEMGTSVNLGLEQGINDSSEHPKSAIEVVANGILDFFRNIFGIHSPSTVMAELGADIDLGLEQGIETTQGGPKNAMDGLGRLLQDAVHGLPDWMRDLGSRAGHLLGDGIGSNQGGVRGAGNSLFTSGQAGANPLVSALGDIGSRAGSWLVNGLNSLVGSAGSAGSNLDWSARGGIDPVIGALWGIGSSAAGSFADAIGGSSAYWQGSSLAGSARDGLDSVDTWSTGYWFAEGFSNGMGGADVWGAAWSIGCSALDAIKSALGIASPSKEARKVGAWFGEGAVLGMKSTERDIALESERMSEAMLLEPRTSSLFDLPNSGTFARLVPASMPVVAQTSTSAPTPNVTLNATVNVYANDASDARGIGKTVVDELYLELKRREPLA